jgi:hypothetical protein
VASTYSNLKIQLMATGENSGTWGNVTNANLGDAIEQAIVETATVTFASANVTLTLSDSNSRQDARALRLNLTGTTGGARDLIVPAIQKPYLVNNGTADIITVKVSGQTGVAVPASTSMLLYNNGTDVVVAFNRVVGNLVGTASNATVLQTARTIAISGNVTGTATSFDGSGNISIPVTAINVDAATAGTLAVGRGGTGATTLNSEAVIIGNTTGAVKFVAPGTDGNVLTSNGTAWISEAAPAGGFSNMVVYTSNTSFTVPTGVTKCKVTVTGGGGGGGGGAGGGAGFGGGAGGTAIELVTGLTPGNSVTITIGAGGARGNQGSDGSAGGTSSFGSFCSATGGGGGGDRRENQWKGIGGIGTGGTINLQGGNQQMHEDSNNDYAGNGADSFLAGGGMGAQGSASKTATTPGFGGGGGGAPWDESPSFVASNGASGAIIVEY